MSFCDNLQLRKLTEISSYVGQDPEMAVDDFRKRIQQYERAYEPIDQNESEYSECHLDTCHF